MSFLFGYIVSMLFEIGRLFLFVALIFDLIYHPEHFSIVSTIVIVWAYRAFYKYAKEQEDYKGFIHRYLPIMIFVNVVPKILQAFNVITEYSLIYKISWTFDVVLLAILCLIDTAKIKGKGILQNLYFALIIILSILGLIYIWLGKMKSIIFYVTIGIIIQIASLMR